MRFSRICSQFPPITKNSFFSWVHTANISVSLFPQAACLCPPQDQGTVSLFHYLAQCLALCPCFINLFLKKIHEKDVLETRTAQYTFTLIKILRFILANILWVTTIWNSISTYLPPKWQFNFTIIFMIITFKLVISITDKVKRLSSGNFVLGNIQLLNSTLIIRKPYYFVMGWAIPCRYPWIIETEANCECVEVKSHTSNSLLTNLSCIITDRWV